MEQQETKIAKKDLIRKHATKLIEKFDIRPSGCENRLAGELSGGNQQKVILARWLATDPEFLILDEPTRGIDVGAKYDIYCLINKMVEDGKSVIMISSEMPELLGMCDRIYVMSEGRLAGEFTAEEATQERIMHAATLRK